MSTIQVSEQEMSYLYTNIYAVYAACGILVYDWFLCLGNEVEFIWNRHSGRTVASLVYAFSRYANLIQALLGVATIYPMSDLSCTANIWAQVVFGTLGLIALGAFSAARAYALSNRNMWLAALIVLLALPPTVTNIIISVNEAPENLPSPLNCSASSSLSQTLFISVAVVIRGSQFAAELLVIGITWWYTYQSYRIRKGVKLGKTISSLLLYNGSLYFIFLTTLCILDIIFSTASLPVNSLNADTVVTTLYDPITSILTCRFMLSLRQFDSAVASTTFSMPNSRVREHTSSMVLEFGAQPRDSLPSFIASFAHPVHVDSALYCEMDPDATVEDSYGSEWREMDGVVPTSTSAETPGQSPGRPGPSQPANLDRSVLVVRE